MELFDSKFVHFMWNDELKGKDCFVANNMEDLIFAVEHDGKCSIKTNALRYSGNNVEPFHPYLLGTNCFYPFVYYDPNYEVKKAYYKEGKKVQVKRSDMSDDWVDCDEPLWCEKCLYRIKPECPCEDGIDSKACVGCEHSEDGKKEYRPYESSAEMIVDFIDRFKVNCPSYCEPLIWVKTKSNDARFLITGFGKKVSVDGVTYSLDELFKYYAYLDGSPVGMEAKE